MDARSLNPDIPENISAALAKAMALHAENRFETVKALFCGSAKP